MSPLLSVAYEYHNRDKEQQMIYLHCVRYRPYKINRSNSGMFLHKCDNIEDAVKFVAKSRKSLRFPYLRSDIGPDRVSVFVNKYHAISFRNM